EIDTADEIHAVGDELIQCCNRLHIERRLGVGIDRSGHTADQETLRMRVLAAKKGVDLDEAALKIERLQVMRRRHQVGFGRQSIGGMAPITIGKDAELATLDKGLEAVPHSGKISRAG